MKKSFVIKTVLIASNAFCTINTAGSDLFDLLGSQQYNVEQNAQILPEDESLKKEVVQPQETTNEEAIDLSDSLVRETRLELRKKIERAANKAANNDRSGFSLIEHCRDMYSKFKDKYREIWANAATDGEKILIKDKEIAKRWYEIVNGYVPQEGVDEQNYELHVPTNIWIIESQIVHEMGKGKVIRDLVAVGLYLNPVDSNGFEKELVEFSEDRNFPLYSALNQGKLNDKARLLVLEALVNFNPSTKRYDEAKIEDWLKIDMNGEEILAQNASSVRTSFLMSNNYQKILNNCIDKLDSPERFLHVSMFRRIIGYLSEQYIKDETETPIFSLLDEQKVSSSIAYQFPLLDRITDRMYKLWQGKLQGIRGDGDTFIVFRDLIYKAKPSFPLDGPLTSYKNSDAYNLDVRNIFSDQMMIEMILATEFLKNSKQPLSGDLSLLPRVLRELESGKLTKTSGKNSGSDTEQTFTLQQYEALRDFLFLGNMRNSCFEWLRLATYRAMNMRQDEALAIAKVVGAKTPDLYMRIFENGRELVFAVQNALYHNLLSSAAFAKRPDLVAYLLREGGCDQFITHQDILGLNALHLALPQSEKYFKSEIDFKDSRFARDYTVGNVTGRKAIEGGIEAHTEAVLKALQVVDLESRGANPPAIFPGAKPPLGSQPLADKVLESMLTPSYFGDTPITMMAASGFYDAYKRAEGFQNKHDQYKPYAHVYRGDLPQEILARELRKKTHVSSRSAFLYQIKMKSWIDRPEKKILLLEEEARSLRVKPLPMYQMEYANSQRSEFVYKYFEKVVEDNWEEIKAGTENSGQRLRKLWSVIKAAGRSIPSDHALRNLLDISNRVAFCLANDKIKFSYLEGALRLALQKSFSSKPDKATLIEEFWCGKVQLGKMPRAFGETIEYHIYNFLLSYVDEVQE